MVSAQEGGKGGTGEKESWEEGGRKDGQGGRGRNGETVRKRRHPTGLGFRETEKEEFRRLEDSNNGPCQAEIRDHHELKETTGGEFRVYRASIRLLFRYIDLLEGYPPENVLI